MVDRKWALITSGATFEGLVTTLIYLEDPGAALFGRRGKDGGQDIRSADGTRNFQAKHHEVASASKAIADAKREAKQIAEYRTLGHTRYNQWKTISHWRLVTNATFNPADQERWDTEVAPKFRTIGLTVDYWERAHLDALLAKHPSADQAYFEGRTRVFLTLPEARELLPQNEPFLPRGSIGGFHGRSKEVAVINAFLVTEKLFLVVHGAGGIGKSRLLLEAGSEIALESRWQVFWVNIDSMEASDSWFYATNPDRPTLLLVDEPGDDHLLSILAEQLGAGRAKQWKVIVAVRSPKDPVLRFLRHPRIQSRVEDELLIEELSQAAAEGMCRDLLESGPLANNGAKWISKTAKLLAVDFNFSQHPIWLTLAIHVLELHGDLSKVPNTAEALAESYLDEIYQQDIVPPEHLQKLLQWIALLKTVNRNDDPTTKLLYERSGITGEVLVKQLLAELVKRRALAERGAHNRLVEIKPDVLRDHILKRWLVVDVGTTLVLSDEANALIEAVLDAISKADTGPLGRSILISLARTDMILKMEELQVSLLLPFFKKLHEKLPAFTATARILLVELLADVAAVRPAEIVALSRELRSLVVQTEQVEGLFEWREVGQDDVVIELASPVYQAAMGCQMFDERLQVLGELCALAEAEADVEPRSSLPNDGKRAAGSIKRVIEGGPNFWSSFEDAAARIGTNMLGQVASDPPSVQQAAAMRPVLESATSLEKSQSWSEDYKIHFTRFVVSEGSPSWKTRKSLLQQIKGILAASDSPLESRVLLWEVFAKAHRNASYCRGMVDDDRRRAIQKELLGNLNWALALIAERYLELVELKAARKLWEWHVNFDKEPQSLEVAEKLESLYLRNDLSGEFEPLTNWDIDPESREDRGRERADELVAKGDQDAIHDFINRAATFFDGADMGSALYTVAARLGECAPSNDTIKEFVHTALSDPIQSDSSRFSESIAYTWVVNIRKGESPELASNIVHDLLESCGSDDKKISLLARFYQSPALEKHIGILTVSEHNRLRSLKRFFIEQGQAARYLDIIGWTVTYDWVGLKAVITEVLEEVPLDQTEDAVSALVNSTYWTVRETERSRLPYEIGIWLLDQLLRVPDIDRLKDHTHWHLEEIVKKVGRAPLSWLVAAIGQRIGMEAAQQDEIFDVIGGHPRLSSYVSPIEINQMNDAAIVSAVESLLEFVLVRGALGFHMPAYLRDIDPNGLVVPNKLAARIATSTEVDDIFILGKIGGLYGIGTSAWRKIAKPVIELANTLEKRDKWSLFGALVYEGMKSWSSAIGEVAELFYGNVRAAKLRLEEEADFEFIEFWEWSLAAAEHVLREEEERAKERPGE